MNLEDSIGARVAHWWADVITRTADGSTARDRRAEIASDVHEQLADAWHRDALKAGSRAVVGRVVRGMPADIVWRTGLEVRPSRFTWHLRNPSTAITSLFVVMFPVSMAADAALPGDRPWPLLDHGIPLWVANFFLGGCILLIAVLALATRLSPSATSGAERFQPRSRLERARRCATAMLGVTLAGSAVLRFGALDLVSGVLWFAFAACVLIYLALIALTFGVRLLTLGRYLPKVKT